MALPTPKVDKKQVNTMNLQVLQRMDPEIEEVLRAVSHVALYQLDVKKMEWARSDVEGSLFVVKRRSQPRFQFVVLNQRSTDNLVQDILGGFQFELSKPYLFYRNKGRVNGIWFFEPEECEAIAQLVQRIQGMFTTAPADEEKSILSPVQLKAASAPAAGAQVDLNALLGQAKLSEAPMALPPMPMTSGMPVPGMLGMPGASMPSMQQAAAPPAGPVLLSPEFFAAAAAAAPQQQRAGGTLAELEAMQARAAADEAEAVANAAKAAAKAAAKKAAMPKATAATKPAVAAAAAPAMMTAEALEQRLAAGSSQPPAAASNATSAAAAAAAAAPALTREAVRKALLSLVNEDTFVDQITEALRRTTC